MLFYYFCIYVFPILQIKTQPQTIKLSHEAEKSVDLDTDAS